MPAPDPLGERPAFVIERFDWGAPDRLELAGAFSGVPPSAVAEPVLAVHGEDGVHRLPAVEQDGDGGDDGGRWAFAWLEAPVAFDRAELELGAGLCVALPAPGDPSTGEPLPVVPAVAAPDRDVEGAVHRLTVEAQELERTLAAAAGARARAAELAQAEIAALRRRVAELEQVAGELAEARGERDDAVRAADEARGEADALRRALADARAGAQELLDRIVGIPTDGR